MNIIELLQWLLLLFGASVLACYIAYQSTIVQKIKRLLYLCDDQALPKWRKWFKPFGIAFESLRDLLNCPYCISWWLGFLTTIVTQDFTTWQSALYACLCIVGVEVFRKLSI